MTTRELIRALVRAIEQMTPEEKAKLRRGWVALAQKQISESDMFLPIHSSHWTCYFGHERMLFRNHNNSRILRCPECPHEFNDIMAHLGHSYREDLRFEDAVFLWSVGIRVDD